ncbi:MAG TPA: TonB-dependent receptor [Chitinophagaceae bacterium]|nr:TonB-dependent receptor [Chitinophagaceae bacterium]
MKYILGFLIALAGLSQSSWAQQKALLRGRIIDSTGAGLPGASLFIHGANTGAITNDSGYFRTEAVRAGRYLVEITYTGYTTVAQTVEIGPDTYREFVLRPAVLEQEGVTVTGVSAATRLRQIPQPVTIIRRDELQKITATNLISGLTHIPGISALTTGPAIAKPFIRGLGYNRVVTVSDGVRQEGQQWGDEHGIEIDDYSVQRVEVLKGPASLMYGSDALAGVINIQSLLPVPEGKLLGSVLSEYQTNARLRGFFGNLGGTRNGFSFNAYGSYKAADDYRNRFDGPVFNSSFYSQNLGLMTGYRGAWGHSQLSVTRFNQHLGIIEGSRDSATGAFLKTLPGGGMVPVTAEDLRGMEPAVPYQHIRHLKVTSDNSFNLGRSHLDVTVAFQHNQRQEFGDAGQPADPTAWFDLKTWTYDLRYHFPYRASWRTTAGVTGMVQNNRNLAADVLIPDFNLLDGGAFLFSQYAKDKLSVSGGIRLDGRHISSDALDDNGTLRFAAFTRNFGNLSGSAGLSYEVTHALTLKANLARGFRAPSLAELASNGAHEGTNRYEIGNVNLPSETSWQGDAGVEVNTQHVTLGASLFYNAISHFIFYRKLASVRGGDSLRYDPASGAPLLVFAFAGQTARLRGLEFNMDIHPHPLDWLHFENTFSLTRATFTQPIDGSRNVPYIPAARYLADLKVNVLPRGKRVRNLYVSLESDYTFAQDRPFTGYNTETATGDYWLVNLAAGAEFQRKGKTLFSLQLSGNNLGDVAYQNHLSRLKYTDVNLVTGRQGVFDMGRNWGFKLIVPLAFDWK